MDTWRRQTWPTFSISPSIITVLDHRADVLNRFLPEFPCGGIFIPGTTGFHAGQRVLLDICFASEKVAVQTSGFIRWKRSRGGSGLIPGYAVEFAEENFGAWLLEVSSAAHPFLIVARERRFLVSLQATCTFGNLDIEGTTRDLSQSGTFVLTDKIVPLGSSIRLTLRPPEQTSIDLDAEVVRWARGPSPGLGLRFAEVDDDAAGRYLGFFRWVTRHASAAASV